MTHISKGLSRVMKHLKDDVPFAVVSAYRDEYSEKENRARHAKLKKDVRSAGYGFIELKSQWKEDGVVTPELSLFVPGCSKRDAIKFGMNYDQHSVLWGNGEGVTYWICTSDNCGGIASVIRVLKDVNLSQSDFEGAFSTLKKGGNSDRNRRFQLSSLSEVDRPNGLPINTNKQ